MIHVIDTIHSSHPSVVSLAVNNASTSKFSAIAGFQPTGDGRLHLGNLLGSALPFASYPCEGSKFAMVADVHALSMGRIPQGFGAAKNRMLRELIACGVRDTGALLFEQSSVPEILALQAFLAPFTPMGDLRRMTQFEQKSQSAEGEPSLGLIGVLDSTRSRSIKKTRVFLWVKTQLFTASAYRAAFL